jgi:SpoVK/Ycf46/Vps4 family AAA+-type ATPase
MALNLFQVFTVKVNQKYKNKSFEFLIFKLRDLFSQAEKEAPSLIFIDELDAICSKRDETNSEVEKRVVSTLLTLMDGADSKNNKVIVLGATNRVDAIDSALRRPGRFDKEVEIGIIIYYFVFSNEKGIPNSQGRREILSVYLSKMPNNLVEEDIIKISSITHGYVGADLASLCKEAGLKTLKRVWGNYK